MRIALFTTSFPSHRESAVNAGISAKDFAEELTALGHEVAVLTPYKRGARHAFGHRETVFFRWLGASDSLSHISLRNPLGILQLASVVCMGALAALRMAARFRPEHIICFWVFPCGFWACMVQMLLHTPYSVWALGSDIWTLGRICWMRLVLRWIGRRASRRYADGLGLGREFESIVGKPVAFLATSRVLSMPATAQGSGGFYLYLGRYHPNKGIDLLIEAIARSLPGLPGNFKLRAHGFGPLEASARARVRELHL